MAVEVVVAVDLASAPAIDSSMSFMAVSVLPGTDAFVIVYNPATFAVQKSLILLPSRSLERKSDSAVANVFNEEEAFRSFDAR